MRIQLQLDDKLIADAMRVTNAATKRQAIEIALRELIASRGRKDVRELFGKNLLVPGYNNKKARR